MRGTSPPRPRLLVVGTPILIAYAVFIGGAPAGELFGVLRAVTVVIAGAVVWAYFRSARNRHDGVDRAAVFALVCFALASLMSAFPRQSLDAALGCLVYVSAFAIARGAFRNLAVRVMVGRALILLSIAVTVVLSVRQGSAVLEFLDLTGWSVFPPLGLPINAQPWGHPYDVALLGVMLYPSWFLGRPSRGRIGAAVLTGCLLAASVFFMGSRMVWAAAAGGVVIWTLPLIGPRWRAWGWRRLAGGLGSAAVLLGVIAIAAPSILDRAFNLVTLGQRGEMWLATIEAWLTRPVAGFGPGSFPWVLQQTDYFDTNTLAPRHPDSALFQLLPEAGLLGVLAVGGLVVALAPRLWRRRSGAARFALGTFIVAGLGSNPTDFPYLVVVALLWAALAAPWPAVVLPAGGARTRAVSIASFASLAAIGVAVVSTTVAGIAYDVGGRFAAAGQYDRAENAFGAAVSLDPGMALYWRQLGTTRLMAGQPGEGVAGLTTATSINPSDDLAWRTLALAFADAGRTSEARAALDRAIEVQRSDPTNLLLSAATSAPSATTERVLGELVQSWPSLVPARAWVEVVSNPSVTSAVVDLAATRWEDGAKSLEPRSSQGLWLGVLADREALLRDAIQASADPSLTEAGARLARCGEAAASAVQSLPTELHRSSDYWALVVQLHAERGEFDQSAARAYSLISGQQLGPGAWRTTLNPLHENDTRGYSADRWGYRRLPIQWPDYHLGLPSPTGGSLRWMLDPAGARQQANVTPPTEC